MITVNIRAAGIDSHLTEEDLQRCLVRVWSVSMVASMSTSLCPLCLGVSTKWCPSTFRPKQDSSLDSAESTCDHLAEVAELIAPLSSFRVFSTPILRLVQVWGGTPRLSLQDGLVLVPATGTCTLSLIKNEHNFHILQEVQAPDCSESRRSR
jgi:hypothetical protein